MKKIWMSLLILVGSTLFLQSCKSSETMVQNLNSLQGEWNIIELNGSSLVPADHQPFPFIGFNISKKSIYGSAGCNNIMGGYESKKVGKISFGKIGMTMMLCPNMELEARVTKMLEEVNSYKFIGANQLAFYGKGSKPIAVLGKNERKEDLSKLEGNWMLERIKNEELGLESVSPELQFDLKKNSISGFAGCNRISGGFELTDGVTRSISFPNIAATRMFCDNMELENKVLEALSTVKSYDVLPSGLYLTFYDAEGNEVLQYKKIQTPTVSILE